jgi:hypothetical protein
VDGARARRGDLQAGQPAGVEGGDGIADRLVAAAEVACDHPREVAAGGGEQDLAAAQHEGIRRAQAGDEPHARGPSRGGRRSGVSYRPMCRFSQAVICNGTKDPGRRDARAPRRSASICRPALISPAVSSRPRPQEGPRSSKDRLDFASRIKESRQKTRGPAGMPGPASGTCQGLR